MQLNERGLSGPVVSRLARISDASLRQWRKRGFLPSVKSPNAWPTYSLLEALKVSVIAELGRYGGDLGFAAEMVEALDLIEDESRFRTPCFLRASHGGWVTDEDGNRHALPPTGAKGGLGILTSDRRFSMTDDEDDSVVIAVDVSKVFKRINAELEKL